jgi:serine/threonine protein kinase
VETGSEYSLELVLAKGTVANVYLGRTPAGVPVVVKALRPELHADKAQRLLLLEEGELMQKLDHPNLRRCLEVIDDPPALVLEAIDGATLDELLKMLAEHGDRVPLSRTLTVGHELASALAYLHARGIVHLGLLPANVLLSAGGRVVLIDLSHGSWPGRKVAIRREPTGEKLGYAYPELWLGQGLGPPADIYRLGVLLWHMLAGRPPELAAPAQIGEPHPGLVAVAAMLPDLPQEVAGLLARLTACTPAARPAADDKLVADLAALSDRFG